MNKTIRILHVFGALDANGAESRVMDIYREIDKDKIQFDFLVHSAKEGTLEKEIRELGGHIYRVQNFKLFNLLKYIRELNLFFQTHREYSIIHGHILSTAFIYFNIAKKYNVHTRIAHSRAGSRTKLSFENIFKEVLKRLSRFNSTDKLAVSRIAAISAFGKRSVNKNIVTIFPNAIDSKKYIFDEKKRKIVRNSLNIENSFVVGHIGRFENQKNHIYLLRIFEEMLKRQKNINLILIGDGKLRGNIEKEIQKRKLGDNVIILGRVEGVEDYLQAMDCLVFPSRFEGLPGVVLEAQAASLMCYISNKITPEVKITELVKYISIKKDPEFWSNIILGDNLTRRKNMYSTFITKGFDISSIVSIYEEYYLKLNERKSI